MNAFDKTRRRLKQLTPCAVLLGLLPGLAQAQVGPSAGSVLQQVAPPPPALMPPGPVIVLPPSGAQPISSSVMIPVSRIVITGNHLLPTAMLQSLVAPAQGQRMNLATLQAYVAQITHAYHVHGYPIAYAYLPPQSIRDGVVDVAVMEPRYDEVQVTGQSRFSAGMVRHTVDVQSGAPVTLDTLNRSLLLLDQTPGLEVAGNLIPGAQPQTSTLQIVRHDLPLFTLDASENNYGNRYTGTYLTNATVTANDPFGYGSLLSVNGIASSTGGLKASGFNVVSPDIWNGLRAGVYGTSIFYQLGGKFASLREAGREMQIGGDLTYPLILQPGRVLNVRFDTEGDWLAQSTRSTRSLSEQMIMSEQLSLNGAMADDFGGVTSADLSFSHGVLAISPGAAKAVDASGPKAEGGYLIGQVQLGRTQNLPEGFVLTGDANGQVSDKNLDSSQQLYLGGPYGVMSYPVGAGGGDEGYLLSAELEHGVPTPGLPGQVSVSALAQNGTVWVNHTVYKGFTGRNRISETGVGLGLAYDWQRFSATASYVVRVGRNSAPGDYNGGDQVWFQVNLAL